MKNESDISNKELITIAVIMIFLYVLRYLLNLLLKDSGYQLSGDSMCYILCGIVFLVCISILVMIKSDSQKHQSGNTCITIITAIIIYCVSCIITMP